jgi:hypothetical protein
LTQVEVKTMPCCVLKNETTIVKTAGKGIRVSAAGCLPGKLLKYQSWDKSYKESGLRAFVDLSLIDTLTFLTNQPLIFVVEQGPFRTEKIKSRSTGAVVAFGNVSPDVENLCNVASHE